MSLSRPASPPFLSLREPGNSQAMYFDRVRSLGAPHVRPPAPALPYFFHLKDLYQRSKASIHSWMSSVVA
jgi:hypothetical protein